MLRHAFLTLLLSLLTSSGLPAQIAPCPIGDDGFDIGCCNPVNQPNVPQFGRVFVSGEYACFRDCGLEREFNVRMRLDHMPLLCDYAIIDCEVFMPSMTGPFMRGTLYAKYSRTFVETATPTGNRRQVWRYLVNGDFTYTAASVFPSPCPIPPEAAANRRVFFHGSIDYRCEGPSPLANPFSARLDLSHLPGCFTHAPWSARPATTAAGGHRDRSYHLVGPGPVSWAAFAPPSGPVVGEKVRSSFANFGSAFSYRCLGEQDIRGGNLNSLNRNCPCGPSTAAPRYVEQRLDLLTGCNMVPVPMATVPLPGISGSGGLITLPLATDGEGTQVSVYFGVARYTDICTNEGPYHAIVGSGTRHLAPLRMFSTSTPGIAPVSATIDLANSRVFGGGVPTIGYGAPYASTIVWQVNLP